MSDHGLFWEVENSSKPPQTEEESAAQRILFWGDIDSFNEFGQSMYESINSSTSSDILQLLFGVLHYGWEMRGIYEEKKKLELLRGEENDG